MGMYTELVLTIQVRPDPAVVAILQYLCDPTNDYTPLPDHPFFNCDRWRWILVGSSHYFVPMSVNKLEYNDISETWCLISCASFKNYDDEIKKFVDWINPYIDAEPGEMIGYSRYESTQTPTILRKV